MTAKRALQIILIVGLCGLSFSGFLTYRELFEPSALSCPSPGEPGTILGWPACVYGFFMYLLVVLAALWGLLAASAGEVHDT
ncbi:MAG TPA: hypothetical protein VHO25_20095 [Polyangiaceae bacterium]|nr:hypothetical protein [Polyangiaceae bacterium]